MKINETLPRENGSVLWGHCQNILDDSRMYENLSFYVKFLASVTLTFKLIVKAYFHVMLTMLYCTAYFYRKKLNISEIKELVYKYCKYF